MPTKAQRHKRRIDPVIERHERQRYERARPSATARGYDRVWRKLRLSILARDPVCMHCRRVPTQEVDHIIPLCEAPQLRLDPDNLQGLCRECHQAKSASDADRQRGRDAAAQH